MSLLMPALVLGLIGLALGLLLGVSSKKFHVPVDERVGQIREILPGANCGGCGFTGCDAYANAVVSGAPCDKCGPGGEACAKKIAELLGRAIETMEPLTAYVHCRGTATVAQDWSDYSGIPDCRSASVIPGGGQKACQSGCLGFGSCVNACKFDALHLTDGIAKVDEDKCVACKACIEACPKGLITLIPKNSLVKIGCNNPNKGPEVKQICSVGCIGCTICAKLAPEGAIEMAGNLPVVHKPKCDSCAASVNKCPTGALVGYGPNEKQPAAPKTAQ